MKTGEDIIVPVNKKMRVRIGEWRGGRMQREMSVKVIRVVCELNIREVHGVCVRRSVIGHWDFDPIRKISVNGDAAVGSARAVGSRRHGQRNRIGVLMRGNSAVLGSHRESVDRKSTRLHS